MAKLSKKIKHTNSFLLNDGGINDLVHYKGS